MFKNTFQSGFLSILYSIGSKPLQIWDKKVRGRGRPGLGRGAPCKQPGGRLGGSGWGLGVQGPRCVVRSGVPRRRLDLVRPFLGAGVSPSVPGGVHRASHGPTGTRLLAVVLETKR